MLSAKVFRFDVVDRQIAVGASAVLAGEIVTPEDLFSGQFDLGARFMHHALEADDGWAGKGRTYCVYFTAAVLYQRCLIQHHQANRAPHITHIKWFKIGVKDEHVFHRKNLR